MDFGLSNEQEMIIDSVKNFVEQELYPHEDEVEKNAKIIPLLEGRKLHQGKATAYVCRQGTCLPPVQTSEELVKLLSY